MPNHQCGQCALCLESSPVNNWLVFTNCGHVLCGRRDCRNAFYGQNRRNGTIRCHTCRAINPFPLTRLFPS
jgi:hypothetical protein